MRKNGKAKNLILVLAVLVLVTVLSAVGVKGAFPDTIALEQSARCGMEEHVHSEECYVGDILVCREKMHTHTENCYIVLLADNDINELLTRVDVAPDNNLESLISATVLQASLATNLKANVSFDGPVASVSPSPSLTPSISPSLFPSISPSLFPSISPSLTPSISPSLIPTMSPSPSISPSADPTMTPSASPSQAVTENKPLSVTQQAHPITNEQIVALNSSVDTSQQGVVLNEHLVTFNLTAGASEEELLAQLLNGEKAAGDASTLALPTKPSTSNRTVNFYFWLDEEAFVYIGYVSLTNSDPDYATKASIAALFNTNDVISNIAASGIETGNNANSGTQIRYRTSAPTSNTVASDFSTNANRIGSSGNNANRVGFENKNNIRYATVMTGTIYGNYTPINFYTVTLDYSQSGTATANQVQYVQSGLDSTLDLDSEYVWVDENGKEVDNSALNDIDGTTTLYAKPKVRTVTFDLNYDGGADWSTKVQPGSLVAAPAEPKRDNYNFGGWYDNASCTGTAYTFPLTVNSDLILYAKWTPVPQTVTLTYKNQNGEITETVPVPYGDTITLNEAYTWKDENNDTVDNTTITVISDREFTGTVKVYTVTYYDKDGDGKVALKTDTYLHGETLAVNYALPTGHNYTAWVDVADRSASYDPKDAETIVVKRNYGFVPVSTFTVTCIDKEGNKTIQTVDPGANATLPTLSSGYVWVLDGDTSGKTYAAGSYGPVSENLTFREVKMLTINYKVDPDRTLNSLESAVSGASYPTPVISGTSSQTGSVAVIQGGKSTLLSVTPNIVSAKTSGTNGSVYNYQVVGYFVGWEVESTGEILFASETLTYEELLSYAGSDGVLNLNGVWHEGWGHAANFFIKYNSDPNGSTAQSDYTPSLFSTYVGFASNYNYSNVTLEGNASADENNSIGYDTAIRAREGYRDGTGKESVWIAEVPPDDYIFQKLREYVESKDENATEISVEKQPVALKDLNSETFAVRWYVFKNHNDSGWHIDGLLVRKVGKITVTKTFDGRADYVEAARNGFTITARSGSLDSSGKFVDNGGKADITLKLAAASGSDTATSIGYDNVETSTGANGSAQYTYTWTISGVGAGEIWQIKENLVTVESAVAFGEWVIVDSSNAQSDSGIGTETSVVGVTFPKDVSSSEWLRVDFTNLYYSQNSILLRKIDGLSGQKLDGAKFEMCQRVTINDVQTEIPMTFNLTETTQDGVTYHTYTYVPDGTGDHAVIACDGTEINISVENFAYGNGPIVIREVVAPTGYVPEPNEVVVGYNGDYSGSTPLIGIINDDISKNYANYSAGLLTIKNFAPTFDLTVQKNWRNCTTYEWADTVVVQLLADGSANKAASVLPSDVSTIQTLKKVSQSDGTWDYTTYTWIDLPVYIDGSQVEWTVKELQIGDEEIKADGTFPNWNSYVTTYKSDGSNGTVAVTNNPKAGTELRVVKMDNNQTVLIPGVTFEIYDATDKLLDTQTTDENGELVFHRLKYEQVYTIVETVTPAGYIGNSQPFKVKIATDGTVTVVEDNGNTAPDLSRYSIRVLNTSGVELPSTGGSGTISYTLGGLLLMAAALLMLYKRSRRKEDAPYV